jgi:hypothetical protein
MHFHKKLLKQGCDAPRLKSLAQQLYGGHHHLVDHFEISISQMMMDPLLVFFPLSLSRLSPDLTVYMSNTATNF